MNKLKPEDKLDRLLSFINEYSTSKNALAELRPNFSDADLEKFIQKKQLDLDGDEYDGDSITRILLKLFNDKYIDKFINEQGIARYSLTFDGEYFISNGGYVKQKEKEVRTAILQTLPIWVTAIGTGLSGLYVIGKFFLWLYGY